MEKVTIRPLRRSIKGVPPGQTLRISRREAAVLVKLKRAEYAPEPKVEAKPSPTPKRARTPKPAPVVEPEPVVEAAPATTETDEPERATRRYTRRDMTAESE